MEKQLWIDLGRCGEDRVGIDLRKETGIGIAGYCGSGKTNLVYRIISKLLEQINSNEVDIHIFEKKTSYLYGQFYKHFEHVIEYENKLHKIRSGLNKITKEIERRTKKLDKSNLTYEEMKVSVKGSEISKWKEKFIIVDSLTVNLLELKNLPKDEQYLKHFNLLKQIAEEGPRVGIKPIFIFLRTVNCDAPIELTKHLSVLCSFMNPDLDYDLWGIETEGLRKPKKIGEALIKTSDYNGFAKTYKLDVSIDSREGIFYKWDPYREMYLKIMEKLK